MREIHLNFNSDMTVKVNTNNVLLSCQKRLGQDVITPNDNDRIR